MLTIAFLTFQFDCTNTLNDQILENVKVEMEPSDPDFEVVCYVPRPSLPYNSPGTTYTLIKLPEDASSGWSLKQLTTLMRHRCQLFCSTPKRYLEEWCRFFIL